MTATCPHCTESIEATDRFCEACGADLHLRRAGTVTAVDSATVETDRPCRSCGHCAPADNDGYCPSCGLHPRDGTDRVELDLGALAGVSDRGHVHARNEDAMALGLLTDKGGLAAVVCDGVSSTRDPEKASRAAAETALDVLLGVPPDAGATAVALTRDAVAAAAKAVSALAPADRLDPPSCTLVSALVDRSGQEITIGWVGDSRAYWLAGPEAAEPARLLTNDHSSAAQGRPHEITRWLGLDGEPEPDIVTLRPTGTGLLLLCSDGLWNYCPNAQDLADIAVPASATGPLGAAATLTTVALDAGGRDNITVVIIPVVIPVIPTLRSPS